MLFRLYKPLVEACFIGLLYLRYGAGNGNSAPMLSWLLDRNGPGSEWEKYRGVVADISRSSVTFNEKLETWIQQLGDQLKQAGRNGTSKTDVDLVDTIVRILQLPYAKNALTGAAIPQLQKAILLPEEMAGLKARLDKAERHCAKCDRQMYSGEMVTLVTDGNGVNVLHCTTCYYPPLMPCRTCGSAMDTNRAMMALLKKGQQCGCQATKKQPEPEAILEEAAPDVVQLRPIEWGGINIGNPFDGAAAQALRAGRRR